MDMCYLIRLAYLELVSFDKRLYYMHMMEQTWRFPVPLDHHLLNHCLILCHYWHQKPLGHSRSHQAAENLLRSHQRTPVWRKRATL